MLDTGLKEVVHDFENIYSEASLRGACQDFVWFCAPCIVPMWEKNTDIHKSASTEQIGTVQVSPDVEPRPIVYTLSCSTDFRAVRKISSEFFRAVKLDKWAPFC